MPDARCAMRDARCAMRDARCAMRDARCAHLEEQLSRCETFERVYAYVTNPRSHPGPEPAPTPGSREAFERVYEYVAREESGEQQSGEREEILAFMADRRDALPLVHTLLYLEEALDVRK